MDNTESWAKQGERAVFTPTKNLDVVLDCWDPYVSLGDDPLYYQFMRKDTAIFQSKDNLPENIRYDYDDKLVQGDKEKSHSAWQSAIDSGATPKTGKFIQQYLSNFYNRTVELHRIGVKLVNGWPIRSYGYVFLD